MMAAASTTMTERARRPQPATAESEAEAGVAIGPHACPVCGASSEAAREAAREAGQLGQLGQARLHSVGPEPDSTGSGLAQPPALPGGTRQGGPRPGGVVRPGAVMPPPAMPSLAGRGMGVTAPGRPEGAGRARPAKAGGPRYPVHVGVTLGVVAGMYAFSLATVGGLQAAADTHAADVQSPAQDALTQLKTAHDALDVKVTNAESAYNAAVGDYQATMDAIAAHEKSLTALSVKLKKISGSASKLAVPVYTASSGGGGGGGGGGGSSIRTIYVTRTVSSGGSASHACTTASGKPC
jgi:hypothetical protein